MEANLITQLVDETFEAQESTTENVGTLIKGQYLEALKCFRFFIQDKTIDFPENWLFFSNINSNVLPIEKWVLHESSEEQDEHSFLKCIPGHYQKLSFYVYKEQLYLELVSAADLKESGKNS